MMNKTPPDHASFGSAVGSQRSALARLCGIALLPAAAAGVLSVGCTELPGPPRCAAGLVQVGLTCVPPDIAARDGSVDPDPRPVGDAGSASDVGVAADAAPAPDGGSRVDSGAVEGPVALPFFVDTLYVMSGYMGGGTVSAAPCETNPGDAAGGCLAIDWTPSGNPWVGFYFQHPENNWGPLPGRVIAAGARRVRFSAWGERGDESANFAVGIRDADGFQLETGVQRLGTTPREFTIELGAARYTDVVGGFAWFLERPAGERVRLYLDDVRWE
jgi:hypothetical protein